MHFNQNMYFLKTRFNFILFYFLISIILTLTLINLVQSIEELSSVEELKNYYESNFNQKASTKINNYSKNGTGRLNITSKVFILNDFTAKVSSSKTENKNSSIKLGLDKLSIFKNFFKWNSTLQMITKKNLSSLYSKEKYRDEVETKKWNQINLDTTLKYKNFSLKIDSDAIRKLNIVTYVNITTKLSNNSNLILNSINKFHTVMLNTTIFTTTPKAYQKTGHNNKNDSPTSFLKTINETKYLSFNEPITTTTISYQKSSLGMKTKTITKYIHIDSSTFKSSNFNQNEINVYIENNHKEIIDVLNMDSNIYNSTKANMRNTSRYYNTSLAKLNRMKNYSITKIGKQVTKQINFTELFQNGKPKSKNKLVMTFDDFLNLCPKSLDDYCLNGGECYLKLYESNFLNAFSSLSSNLIQSAIPTCRCKYEYEFHGLVLINFSGQRCQFITHSFTYLTYVLTITILCLILLLIGLVICLFKITCFDNRKIIENKVNNVNNLTMSSEYSKKVVENKLLPNLSYKISWLKNFKTSKNSWKYVKINDRNKISYLNNETVKKQVQDNQMQLDFKNSKKSPINHQQYQDYFYDKNHKQTNLYRKKKLRKHQNTFQRYLRRRTRKILKNIESLSETAAAAAASAKRFGNIYNEHDNFLFLNNNGNRNFQSKFSNSFKIFSNNNFQHSSSMVSLNKLDSVCASNVYVYPKPSRSTCHTNHFNSRNPENEATIKNGALYY